MEVDIKGVNEALFVEASKHLTHLGATRLVVFPDRRQTEGPWLTAFVILNDRRHTRWTGEAWQGRTLDQQAHDLANALLNFAPDR